MNVPRYPHRMYVDSYDVSGPETSQLAPPVKYPGVEMVLRCQIWRVELEPWCGSRSPLEVTSFTFLYNFVDSGLEG